MTSFFETKVTCGVCGRRSGQTLLASTNTFGGWPDLDTRPAEMQRSTMDFWVLQCPGCGYCASDLEQAGKNSKKTVESPEYRALLAAPAFPELSRRFLASALLQETEGELSSAGWSALHAAWDCDDSKKPETAVAARERALSLFERARAAGQAIFSDGTDSRILTTDLLRRNGRLEEAKVAAVECLEAAESEQIRRILEYQLHLIERRDTGCHTIGEAKKWKESG